jgi:hypothetical protein
LNWLVVIAPADQARNLARRNITMMTRLPADIAWRVRRPPLSSDANPIRALDAESWAVIDG